MSPAQQTQAFSVWQTVSAVPSHGVEPQESKAPATRMNAGVWRCSDVVVALLFALLGR